MLNLDQWWINECNKIAEVDDKRKWKLIDKLTNYRSTGAVQPIKKVINGSEVYLFEDSTIRVKFEDHYIRKNGSKPLDNGVFDKELLTLTTEANAGAGEALMK